MCKIVFPMSATLYVGKIWMQRRIAQVLPFILWIVFNFKILKFWKWECFVIETWNQSNPDISERTSKLQKLFFLIYFTFFKKGKYYMDTFCWQQLHISIRPPFVDSGKSFQVVCLLSTLFLIRLYWDRLWTNHSWSFPFLDKYKIIQWNHRTKYMYMLLVKSQHRFHLHTHMLMLWNVIFLNCFANNSSQKL